MPEVFRNSWARLCLIAALVCLALGVLALPSVDVSARNVSGSADVSVLALPVEAQATLRLIRAGGPFPYRKDGSVFHNRERRLPHQPRGYYTEYTVKTPGENDRGARRIVAGGAALAKMQFWYTDDHYRTFRRIVTAEPNDPGTRP